MIKKWWFLILVLCNCSSLIYGDNLQEDVDRAAVIVKEFEDVPEKGIPESVLKNSKGLAIINVIKGGFIFSGRVGEGLVIAKTPKGWSAPSAIGIGGVGFGLQIGGSLTEFILILNTKEAVEAFAKKGNVSLGADITVAAGPVGRAAEASVLPMAAVYSYSRSQGLFAGVSLEGTVIFERVQANTEFYKKNVTAEELLSGKIPPPKSADNLYKELNKYVKKKWFDL